MNQERDTQIVLARARLEILNAIVAAQNRHAEVSAAIASAPDQRAAIRAVAELPGVGEVPARAIADLPWRRLTKDSQRQVREERDAIIADLRDAESEPDN